MPAMYEEDFITSIKIEHPEKIQRIGASATRGEQEHYGIVVQDENQVVSIALDPNEMESLMDALNLCFRQIHGYNYFD